VEAAGVIDEGLRSGDLSARAFEGYERTVRRRYRHFRRFAVGFYDPAFREIWFTPNKKMLGIYGAIVSVLAGNWRPSLLTRAKVGLFFGLVALKRLSLNGRRGTPASPG